MTEPDDPWEAEVRRTLAARAAAPEPRLPDLAGHAISRARRIQRRRNLAGLAAVAGATMIAAGVLLQDWQGGPAELGATGGFQDQQVVTDVVPPAPPVPRSADDQAIAEQVSVDVVGNALDGGMVLITASGQTIGLGPVTGVVSAHRVGEGWALVGRQTSSTRLWWVTADQEPVSLVAGADSLVVDGARVAWRRGVVMTSAELSGAGRLEHRVFSNAPEGGELVGFAGDAVVLRRTAPAGWDTWRPALGAYRPEWSDEVLAVHGGLPGGAGAVGTVVDDTGSHCVAVLDRANRLAPGRRVCPTGVPAVDVHAATSPDGRWLLISGRSEVGDAPRTLLVDLVALAGQDRSLVGKEVAVVDAVPELTGPPVWVAPDQVLLPIPDGLARLWPEPLLRGAAGGLESIPLTGPPPVVVQPA